MCVCLFFWGILCVLICMAMLTWGCSLCGWCHGKQITISWPKLDCCVRIFLLCLKNLPLSFCPWDYIRQIIQAHKVHQLIELYGQSECVPRSAVGYRKAAKWGTVLLNVGDSLKIFLPPPLDILTNFILFFGFSHHPKKLFICAKTKTHHYYYYYY
jgi:hypothetical protein